MNRKKFEGDFADGPSKVIDSFVNKINVLLTTNFNDGGTVPPECFEAVTDGAAVSKNQ
jgi:hypothetical protein